VDITAGGVYRSVSRRMQFATGLAGDLSGVWRIFTVLKLPDSVAPSNGRVQGPTPPGLIKALVAVRSPNVSELP
jgi:hypothetical protein